MEQQDNDSRISTIQETKKVSKKNYSKYFSSSQNTSKRSRNVKAKKTSKSSLVITLVSCYIVVFLLCGIVVINIIQNKALDEKYSQLQNELTSVEQENAESEAELQNLQSRDLQAELEALGYSSGDVIIVSSTESEKILETEEKEQTNWFNEFCKAVSKFLGVN